MAYGRGVKPKACMDCGARRADGVHISFRALCLDCAIKRQTKSAVEQSAKAGPYYEHWKQSMRDLADKL